MRKLWFALFITAMLTGCSAADSSPPPTTDVSTNIQPAVSQPEIIEPEIPDDAITLEGIVVTVSEDDLLLADHAGALYTVNLSDASMYNNTPPPAGATVIIYYSGAIRESYPAQLSAQAVTIEEYGRDNISIYRKILSDIWTTEIPENINIVALDLTMASNLTDVEKSALYYLLQLDTGYEVLATTYAELERNGTINANRREWSNGVLLRIEMSEELITGFRFDAMKWRSALDAHFYSNCIAEYSEDGWSYTIGSELVN